MIARKSSSKKGTDVPQDWTDRLSLELNETYQDSCKKHNRIFDVYGQIYNDELLVVASWLSENDQYTAPITCFLSCEKDQFKTEQNFKATENDFVDIFGLFFDEIFSQDEWDEFEPNWQEVKYKKETYFYKLSRENIELTLEADKLLGEDFEDEELDH
jgi:hypothetical protein